MKDKYIIPHTSSIIDALRRLNDLHSVSMTLFVVDGENHMVGTLTDGDVRRALIRGESPQSDVGRAMNKEYHSIYRKDDLKCLRNLRMNGITLIPVLDAEQHIEEIIDLTESKSALPIDAVLMAGGKGERLRPLTLNTPKPLLKIGDKAIIDRNIDRLIDFGVKNISVTVNYLKEKIIEHYAVPKGNGIQVGCIAEEQFFGTIGSLKLIREFHNDTILVMNSDLLTDIDFEDFYLHFKENDAMMSAAAIPYSVSVPYGIFELNGRNISGVTEKPVLNLYANAGIYLIKKEALKYIPEKKVFNATDLIEALVADKQSVIRYPLTGLWIDIGTPEEYKKAQELVRHLK
ncbi:MAG: CBS domain-containing protein [Muribaculaceae bacterium]|nr:CBS domain-containing protein [Muribaculaceae bacterium]